MLFLSAGLLARLKPSRHIASHLAKFGQPGTATVADTSSTKSPVKISAHTAATPSPTSPINTTLTRPQNTKKNISSADLTVKPAVAVSSNTKAKPVLRKETFKVRPSPEARFCISNDRLFLHQITSKSSPNPKNQPGFLAMDISPPRCGATGIKRADDTCSIEERVNTTQVLKKTEQTTKK